MAAEERNRLRKAHSCWRRHAEFPVGQWRSLLGQTIARCVALRKRVDEEVSQLRFQAAEYLLLGLLHRADEKVALASRGHKMYLAYILIQQYCEQAINCLVDIENCEGKQCPLQAREALSSLLYVMPRCKELVELNLLGPLISMRFGKSFVSMVMENSTLSAVDEKGSIKLPATSFIGGESQQASLKTFTMKDQPEQNGSDLAPLSSNLPCQSMSCQDQCSVWKPLQDQAMQNVRDLASTSSSLPSQSIPCRGQSSAFSVPQAKQVPDPCTLHRLAAIRSSRKSPSKTCCNQIYRKQRRAASLGSANWGKISGKTDVLTRSRSQKLHVEPLHEPSNKIRSTYSEKLLSTTEEAVALFPRTQAEATNANSTPIDHALSPESPRQIAHRLSSSSSSSISFETEQANVAQPSKKLRQVPRFEDVESHLCRARQRQYTKKKKAQSSSDTNASTKTEL